VNTSNLNLVVRDTDFRSMGLGPGVAATRTWNTDPSRSGMFGNGWSFSYESTLKKFCAGAMLLKGSGQVMVYSAELCPAEGSPVLPITAIPPPGNFDRLTWMEGDYWILEKKETRERCRYDLREGDLYRLTSITDGNGNVLTVHYDAAGNRDWITDAAGRKTTFSYDAHGRCVSMTTPDGRTATYAYDAGGNLVSTVDLLGTDITYTYDVDGYMTSLSYAGKTTSFTYDTSGGWKHVATVTDADGKTRTYTATATETMVTDPLGGITRYAAQEGRTTTVTDPLGHVSTTAYTAGLPTTYKDFRGNETRVEYDLRGNVTRFTDRRGKSTVYAYDARDNVTAATDASGRTWTFLYDDRDNLLQKVSPSGRTLDYTYNAAGQMTAFKDSLGYTTSFSYDPFGNLASVTDPYGKATTVSYDAFGFNRASLTDANGNTTQFTHDNNGRVTRITHPDGTFLAFERDPCSLTASTDEKGFTTIFERDSMSNPTRILDPLGNPIDFIYDGNGNITRVTDPGGHSTDLTYDKADRPVEMLNAAGFSVYRLYDANGNLVGLTDERANSTSLGVDADDAVISITDPSAHSVLLSRDSTGRISGILNGRGMTLGLEYDEEGRIKAKNYEGTSAGTYAYDADNNLVSITDAGGTTTFEYDAGNRATGINYPSGKILSFTYDDAGNPKSILYPDGTTVTYTYDNRNRIESLSWGTHQVTFSYDAAGNLIGEQRSNGTRSSYTHDENHKILTIRHQKDSTPFADMSCVRDARGNVVAETCSLPLLPTFEAVEETGSYNAVNQVLALGGSTYTYDDDGNLVTIAGSRSFAGVYDPENRPVEITAGDRVTSYTYDALGNRTAARQATRERLYHHDLQGRLLFETDGNFNPVASYLYAGGRLVAVKQSSACYFYHFDRIGSTIALTDETGSVVRAYAYDPFGRVVRSTGTLYNPFTFVGAFGVMDEGDGLFFMKARYYDALSGRFLHKDPIGFPGGTNLYAYARNNPVNFIDPTGWFDWTLSGCQFLDKPIDWMTNVSAGFGDALSFGVTGYVRKYTESDWTVDEGGGLYKASWWGGAAYNSALGVVGSLNAGARTVLYSGRSASGALAGCEAALTGKGSGMILAETLGGKVLNAVDANVVSLPMQVWKIASGIFAANAKGEVQVFMRGTVSSTSVWNTVEQPLLKWLGNASVVLK